MSPRVAMEADDTEATKLLVEPGSSLCGRYRRVRDRRELIVQSAGAIAQNFGLPRRPPRIPRMGKVARRSPDRVQENRSGMFVGRDRVTERHVAEILQSVRKRIVLGIARLPELVALGEFFRRE